MEVRGEEIIIKPAATLSPPVLLLHQDGHAAMRAILMFH